jgi:hypothetical protein
MRRTVYLATQSMYEMIDKASFAMFDGLLVVQSLIQCLLNVACSHKIKYAGPQWVDLEPTEENMSSLKMRERK